MSAFKPNRSLLNVNFEGYKLSTSVLSVITHKHGVGVSKIDLSRGHHSYQYTRYVSLRNYLINDPWNPSVFYWCASNESIVCAVLTDDDVKMSTVFSECLGNGNHGNISLVFPSSNSAVVCDSTGMWYINTGQRDTHLQTWSIAHHIRHCCRGPVFVQCANNSDDGVNVLLVEVLDPSSDGPSPSLTLHVCVLRWKTIIPAGDGTYTTGSDVVLHSATMPLYNWFVGPYLLIASESVSSITDSTNIGVHDTSVHALEASPNAAYEWTQTDTDVTITVPMTGDVSKRDVVCVVRCDEVVVGISDGTTLLRAALYDMVSPEDSTWTIESGRIEVTLEKQNVNGWPNLLKDDTCSQGISTAASKGVDIGEGSGVQNTQSKPIFQDPLEDCDLDDEDTSIFSISQDGTITQTSLGGKQLLFTLSSSLCLRHDVDALLYTPSISSNQLVWQHEDTFNALGYVQASKRDKKFLMCSEDMSYAVLTDCNRHLFIYYQSVANSNQASQYVHSFSKDSAIWGIHCSNDGHLLVLLDNELVIVKVRSNIIL